MKFRSACLAWVQLKEYDTGVAAIALLSEPGLFDVLGFLLVSDGSRPETIWDYDLDFSGGSFLIPYEDE